MRITDLNPVDTSVIEQVASILLDCFGRLPSGYPTFEEALEEVHCTYLYLTTLRGCLRSRKALETITCQ